MHRRKQRISERVVSRLREAGVHVALLRYETCEECHGDGMCTGCQGHGRMLLQASYLTACLDCPGTGACQACHGRGWTRTLLDSYA